MAGEMTAPDAPPPTKYSMGVMFTLVKTVWLFLPIYIVRVPSTQAEFVTR